MSKKLYKRINLGYKEETISKEASKTTNKVYYPTLYISHSKLPFNGEDIGKSFKCNATLEFVGIRESSSKNGKDSYSYDFEVKDMTFTGK